MVRCLQHISTSLQGKLTRQVAQTPTDLGCLPIAPYDITHGFMVSDCHKFLPYIQCLSTVQYFVCLCFI